MGRTGVLSLLIAEERKERGRRGSCFEESCVPEGEEGETPGRMERRGSGPPAPPESSDSQPIILAPPAVQSGANHLRPVPFNFVRPLADSRGGGRRPHLVRRAVERTLHHPPVAGGMEGGLPILASWFRGRGELHCDSRLQQGGPGFTAPSPLLIPGLPRIVFPFPGWSFPPFPSTPFIILHARESTQLPLSPLQPVTAQMVVLDAAEAEDKALRQPLTPEMVGSLTSPASSEKSGKHGQRRRHPTTLVPPCASRAPAHPGTEGL